MSKIEKVPVYKNIIVCGNCGYKCSEYSGKYSNRGDFDLKCCVCKKEGCDKCSTGRTVNNVRYLYHLKCKNKLPKKVLREMQKIDDEYDRLQRWSEYINRY